jgi:sulfoxide reductase heme-binding subunit YedZ
MSWSKWVRRIGKPVVFVVCLIPLTLLVRDFLGGRLSANPIEDLTHRTGDWTLIFLLITLGITPLRRITKWGVVLQFRRMLGLFAFFYGILHFSIYIVFDHFFDVAAILEDVTKRPYVTVGFTSLMLLVPLAVTSTKGWIKRLGGRRWNRLHQLVYVTAAGGVLHYLWLVKADTRRPIIFGVILVALLATRLWRPRKRPKRVEAPGAPATPSLAKTA